MRWQMYAAYACVWLSGSAVNCNFRFTRFSEQTWLEASRGGMCWKVYSCTMQSFDNVGAQETRTCVQPTPTIGFHRWFNGFASPPPRPDAGVETVRASDNDTLYAASHTHRLGHGRSTEQQTYPRRSLVRNATLPMLGTVAKCHVNSHCVYTVASESILSEPADPMAFAPHPELPEFRAKDKPTIRLLHLRAVAGAIAVEKFGPA